MELTTDKIKRKIITSLDSLSTENLLTIDDFISKIKTTSTQNENVLHYFGLLEDIDDEVFDDLTTNLHENRCIGKARII